MSAASRAAEADRVEAAYRWAITEVGLSVIADGTQLWAGTSTSSASGSFAAWLASVKKLVKLRRKWMVDLAVTYYRLVRALRTGSTVNGPDGHEDHTSIESLRQDFEHVLDEIEKHSGTAPKESTPKPVKRPTIGSGPGDNDPIEVDDIDTAWDEILGGVDDDVDEQLDALMDNLGPKNWGRKLEVIDTSDPADEVDKKRDDAHQQVGRRTAAELERISLMYARGTTAGVSLADTKVLGWVRYSTTGTPCGWCAMLISRGAVYKSKASASLEGDSSVFTEFHTNCKCNAVPVFSREQYESSPLFALNREYSSLWPKVTSGLGGKDALSAWRKYFRQQAKQTKSKPAQAAA